MDSAKVLIVEDSILVAKAIKIILEREKIDTELLTNGSGVVDLVKKKNIKLVILDLMMPGISGIDVFKSLKSDNDTKDVKVMVLTARTDAMKWNPELKLCDKFMAKPFDNDILVSEVKRLLK